MANKHPDVAVKIILRWKNKTLILKHKNNAYDFPGGRMHWGESIFGALKRELKEELNYFLSGEFKLFNVWNYISKDKKRHSIFIYHVHTVGKKPELISSEGAQILWLNKKALKLIIKDKSFLKKIFMSKSL